MTSMPYQVVLMRIRHIYCWDNPTETALWLAGYVFFWAMNQLTGAAVRHDWPLLFFMLLSPDLADSTSNRS